MRALQNCLMLAAVCTVAGSNFYFRFTNDWIAGGLAVVMAYFAYWAVKKITAELAYREIKREYGQDWG